MNAPDMQKSNVCSSGGFVCWDANLGVCKVISGLVVFNLPFGVAEKNATVLSKDSAMSASGEGVVKASKGV